MDLREKLRSEMPRRGFGVHIRLSSMLVWSSMEKEKVWPSLANNLKPKCN